MKKTAAVAAIAALLLVTGHNAVAQDAGVQALRANVTVGAILSSIGLSVGVEKIVESVVYEDFMINGTWGIGADIGYSSKTYEWYDFWAGKYGFKYTYIPFFLYASYHHALDNEKLDPFIKLGLDYVYIGYSTIGNASITNPDDSYIDLVSQIGARYQVNEKMAVVVSLGRPWLASVGVDISLK